MIDIADELFSDGLPSDDDEVGSLQCPSSQNKPSEAEVMKGTRTRQMGIYCHDTQALRASKTLERNRRPTPAQVLLDLIAGNDRSWRNRPVRIPRWIASAAYVGTNPRSLDKSDAQRCRRVLDRLNMTASLIRQIVG